MNLVHRLLKNSVTEKTGKRAYVFVTDQAATRLGLPVDSGILHEERYADVGTVRGLVIDVIPPAIGGMPALAVD